MELLQKLEKKINSELNTKINSSKIKNDQIYLNIDSNDIIEVIVYDVFAVADTVSKTSGGSFGGAITVQAMDNVSIIGEYIHDEDYDVSDGGTGEDKSTVTLKLSAEF